MPRITDDIYNQQQVRLNPLPGPRVSPDTGPNAGQILGAGLQQFGQNVQQFAAREQDMADDLRVEDSINRLRERQLDLTLNPQSGYSTQLGKSVIERPSGKPLTDDYLEQFQSTVKELGERLTTDRQRQKFAQRSGLLANELRGGLMRHEAAQLKAHANSVDEGVVKVEVENAARNWNDPIAVESSFARIDAAIERKRQREGVAAESIIDIRRDIRSNAHKGILSQALGAKDFKFVDSYLKANGGDMNAKDMLEITKAYRAQDVADFAVMVPSQIVREVEAKTEPTPYNSLFAAVATQESGNRQLGSNGQPITSSAGAVGVMQVLPSTGTEAARLAGLPWDPNRLRTDEAYNRRLGEAYLREQLQTNRGDVAKALAAYNAGPGALQKAVEAAGKAGKPDAWLSYLPKETQDYVPKVLGSFAGGVQPARPNLLEMEREVERRAGNDLEKRRAGIQEVQRLFQALESGRRQRDEQIMDATFKALEQNGGSVASLPLDLRRNIPGDKLATVHSYAKSAAKRASGVDNETNQAAYLFLSDEKVLRGMSQSAFFAYREQLSEADFKHFTNEYRKANGQSVENKIEDLNSGYIKQVLDNRLRGIKIDPSPDDKASGEQQRVGAIRQYIDKEILAEQKAKGGKLTDAEIQSVIDARFAIDQKFRSVLISSSDPNAGQFGESRKLLATTIKDIPADIRKTIEDGFKAKSITPSDQDILTVYLRMRTAQSRAR